MKFYGILLGCLGVLLALLSLPPALASVEDPPEITGTHTEVQYEYGTPGTTSFLMQLTDWIPGEDPITSGKIVLKLYDANACCLDQLYFDITDSVTGEPPSALVDYPLRGSQLRWEYAIVIYMIEDSEGGEAGTFDMVYKE